MVSLISSPGYDWEHYRKGYTQFIPGAERDVLEKVLVGMLR